jgi:hypothetical protein
VSGPVVHGYSAYGNGLCRCDVCRAAWTNYNRQRRQRLRSQPLPPSIAHGTSNAYNNYQCRCDRCRSFKSQENARWRQARRKAAAS